MVLVETPTIRCQDYNQSAQWKIKATYEFHKLGQSIPPHMNTQNLDHCRFQSRCHRSCKADCYTPAILSTETFMHHNEVKMKMKMIITSNNQAEYEMHKWGSLMRNDKQIYSTGNPALRGFQDNMSHQIVPVLILLQICRVTNVNGFIFISVIFSYFFFGISLTSLASFTSPSNRT